ncbi:hypothetical protein C8A01DRAFT_37679 [Parachaetomium inaequale]|uniref:Uncharacterized protein n=1 Tax=Parachaetomium inaequale TaxID=2588326 RepID=A0AAN6PH09_9PEZI|nr:hypothetical protein C8A01DRAFT_37679 [Parachaetomium inaequale]
MPANVASADRQRDPPPAPSGPPLGYRDPPAPAASVTGPVPAAPKGGMKRASSGDDQEPAPQPKRPRTHVEQEPAPATIKEEEEEADLGSIPALPAAAAPAPSAHAPAAAAAPSQPAPNLRLRIRQGGELRVVRELHHSGRAAAGCPALPGPHANARVRIVARETGEFVFAGDVHVTPGELADVEAGAGGIFGGEEVKVEEESEEEEGAEVEVKEEDMEAEEDPAAAAAAPWSDQLSPPPWPAPPLKVFFNGWGRRIERSLPGRWQKVVFSLGDWHIVRWVPTTES